MIVNLENAESLGIVPSILHQIRQREGVVEDHGREMIDINDRSKDLRRISITVYLQNIGNREAKVRFQDAVEIAFYAGFLGQYGTFVLSESPQLRNASSIHVNPSQIRIDILIGLTPEEREKFY
jgi:hypothetical protein